MRDRFSRVYRQTPVLLPVIHPIGRDEAMRAADQIAEAGCVGAFIINQGVVHRLEDLVALARDVEARTGLIIGVNALGYTNDQVITSAALAGWTPSAIWSDVRQPRGIVEWNCVYFGPVAFKYQAQPEDIEMDARIAVDEMDVVTTSGPATGQAASVEKLIRIRRAVGEHPVALASGVSPENIFDYLGLVDAFLVASSIESKFGVFDVGRLRLLQRLVRGQQDFVDSSSIR